VKYFSASGKRVGPEAEGFQPLRGPCFTMQQPLDLASGWRLSLCR